MVKILQATVKDIPGILQVRKQTWLATYPNREHGITRALIAAMDFDSDKKIERQKRYLQNSRIRVLVAKQEGSVIGYATGRKFQHWNYLGSMYILPNWQGKGVGRKLLAAVLRWFGKNKPVRLGVAAYNYRAIGFYAKFGFVVSKTRAKAPILPNGRMMPSWEMLKVYS